MNQQTIPQQLIFLPGAGGNASFWKPASKLINHPASREFIEWPGIGGVPEHPEINSINDLATVVAGKIEQPTALIAQSMGGVVGVLSLLKKKELVTHLILCVTSGGINIDDIRPDDWRPAYLDANPSYPRWFTEFNDDLTEALKTIEIPVLLIWGDSDPISPIAIGERLNNIFSNSQLEIISGGDHGLAKTLASDVAPLIEEHFKRT